MLRCLDGRTQEVVGRRHDGNQWGSYGVTLALSSVQSRKGADFRQMVIKDWVPQGSPYWTM